MPIENGLIISESDYEKLCRLISVSRSEATAALAEELRKADVYPDTLMPIDVVSLYSKTYFKDIKSGAKRLVTIVMPWESSITEMRISILSPVGIALIGARLGATIEWPLLHNSSVTLQIEKVQRAAPKKLFNA